MSDLIRDLERHAYDDLGGEEDTQRTHIATIAADEITRLTNLLLWCHRRLATQGYRDLLTKYMATPVEADHTPITPSLQ